MLRGHTHSPYVTASLYTAMAALISFALFHYHLQLPFDAPFFLQGLLLVVSVPMVYQLGWLIASAGEKLGVYLLRFQHIGAALFLVVLLILLIGSFSEQKATEMYVKLGILGIGVFLYYAWARSRAFFKYFLIALCWYVMIVPFAVPLVQMVSDVFLTTFFVLLLLLACCSDWKEWYGEKEKLRAHFISPTGFYLILYIIFELQNPAPARLVRMVCICSMVFFVWKFRRIKDDWSLALWIDSLLFCYPVFRLFV